MQKSVQSIRLVTKLKQVTTGPFHYSLSPKDYLKRSCHSLTHARYAGWHVGQRQRYSTPVCSGPASEQSPGEMEGLIKLPFYSSPPGVFGSPPFPLPLWCPVKGCAGDVAWLSSHHMPDPSPSPSHDDGTHAVLVAAGEKMLVGDGRGPEYS